MKLNIGSSHPKGKYRHEPWINIDVAAEEVKMSNVMKVDALEMGSIWQGEFDEIHAVHVLEHVNRNHRQEFVDQCEAVLAPGGTLFIEVPDFQAVANTLVQAWKDRDLELAHRMTTSIFGKQRYTGDQHCWGFTGATLSELIRKSFEYPPVIYRNGNIGHMISKHYTQEPILLAKITKK